MFTIETTIFMDRPQQEVFDFVTNPDNTPKWQSQVISSEYISEGPPGVGSINRSVSKFLGREINTTSEITVWDPPTNQVLMFPKGRSDLKLLQNIVQRERALRSPFKLRGILVVSSNLQRDW